MNTSTELLKDSSEKTSLAISFVFYFDGDRRHEGGERNLAAFELVWH